MSTTTNAKGAKMKRRDSLRLILKVVELKSSLEGKTIAEATKLLQAADEFPAISPHAVRECCEEAGVTLSIKRKTPSKAKPTDSADVRELVQIVDSLFESVHGMESMTPEKYDATRAALRRIQGEETTEFALQGE
ncbi:MAG: hypothetical protein AAFX06_19940 [Planctomycetota bacterium]